MECTLPGYLAAISENFIIYEISNVSINHYKVSRAWPAPTKSFARTKAAPLFESSRAHL
jgi:hypothetical protein